mmetsp:Transcript_538/g.734  ORF Transcript_538/g.734 Transcript_538/m.734 type:complete len:87 (-) Transcript_538:611-871(-)
MSVNMLHVQSYWSENLQTKRNKQQLITFFNLFSFSIFFLQYFSFNLFLQSSSSIFFLLLYEIVQHINRGVPTVICAGESYPFALAS